MKRTPLYIFIVFFMLIITVGILSVMNIRDMLKNEQDVTHTNKIFLKLEQLISKTKDLYISNRTYLITGDTGDLAQQDRINAEIRFKIDSLQDMMKDTISSTHLYRLHELLRRRNDTFGNKTIELRKKAGFEEAKKFFVENKDQRLMVKDIPGLIDKIKAREQELLTMRQEYSDRSARRTLIIIVSGTVISIIITLIAIYIIRTDIRRRIGMEKALREAKQSAEESTRLKEAFLANMSHEIRTPMNAIIGFTDILSRRNLGKEEMDYLLTIKTAGKNLLTIINDILDISKIEAGMVHFEKHLLSVNDIFKSLQVMLSQQVRKKKLELVFDCDSQIPGGLIGDPTRLSQVIINITNNAIKFTHKGRIEVKARLQQATEKNAVIVFSITDTGIGIAPDKVKGVFERFTQAESNTTRKYGGTGLGLSIAKQLVELQGGSIAVSSTVGLGSVFTFTMPFDLPNGGYDTGKKSRQHPSFDMRSLAGLRILLVEDNLINVKLIESLFAEHGITPALAANGKIAVEKVATQPFDIVLMDMEMPEMNGYEASTAIREQLKNSVPIIAMTAHAMAGEREKCLRFGMNDYISKPIIAELLFEKIYLFTRNPNHKISQPVMVQEKPGRVINLEYLNSMMGGKKEVITRIIEAFLEQVPEEREELNNAISVSDYTTIKGIAHKMKSSVAVMGVGQVEQLLQTIEQLAANHAPVSEIALLNQQVNELCTRAFAEAREALQNKVIS